jgi:hypothetical protein
VTSDAAFAFVSEEIRDGEQSILETLSTNPDRWWSASELKIQARKARSAGAMSLALEQLIAERKVVVNPQTLFVRLPSPVNHT